MTANIDPASLSAMRHEIQRRIRRAAVARKWCPGCSNDLPTASFGANAARTDGLQVYCRACRRR